MHPAASAALTAFFLVSAGSSVQGHLRFLVGVPCTVAGFVMAWVAALRAQDRDPGEAVGRGSATAWLSVLATITLLVPSSRGTALWYTVVCRVFAASAIVLVGVVAADAPQWRRRATWALVWGAVGLQLMAPLGVHPLIDVWSWTGTCTRALLHGIHPYTVQAPDLERGAFDFGSTPSVYPYTPLVLLVSAPAEWLAGDYRFGLALCLPAAALLFRAAGRRLAVDDWLLDVMTLALVLYPRAVLVTALGYTEPLLVLTLAVFVWLAVRSPRGWGQALAFLLLPALKQYVAAPALLYAAMHRRPRALALGILGAAATVLPFVIWNREATLAGVLYLARAPIGFRIDSDSLSAMLAVTTGFEAPRWLGILAQFVVAGLAYRHLRHAGMAGLLLASSLALLASFLLATQAFFNYYYFARVPLLYASLVLSSRRGVVPV